MPSFFEALEVSDRVSLINEEISNWKRLKLHTSNFETLLELIQAEQEVNQRNRLQGDCSYRILRSKDAEFFNYASKPTIHGLKQTDFVVSTYKSIDEKLCSLDVVNAAAYLAFIEPREANNMSFSTEYFIAKRKQEQAQLFSSANINSTLLL